MINKKDKNNLIILVSLIVFIALVVFFYKTTRRVPLEWIGAFYIVLMVVCWGLVAKKYLGIYGIDNGIFAWIPIINCINIFSPATAILTIVCIAASLTCGVAQLLPVDVAVKFFGDVGSLNFYDRMGFAAIVCIMLSLVVIGAGFVGVYRDVRNMISEVFGNKGPKSDAVTYPLLFIPVISVLGYINIITALNRLSACGYSAADKQGDDDMKFTEV